LLISSSSTLFANNELSFSSSEDMTSQETVGY
jgi:hypothetical protein